jgi:hypothetical protein
MNRKKTGSFYILGYLLEIIIKIWRSGNFFLRNLANLGYFYYGKSFVKVEIIIFRSKFDEVSPQKKTLELGDQVW